MSDRIKGLVVVFEHDVGEEYAKIVADGIRCIRGVQSVEPQVGDLGSDYIVRVRTRSELRHMVDEVFAKHMRDGKNV